MPPKRYNFRARKTPVVWVDDDTLKTKKEEEDQDDDEDMMMMMLLPQRWVPRAAA